MTDKFSFGQIFEKEKLHLISPKKSFGFPKKKVDDFGRQVMLSLDGFLTRQNGISFHPKSHLGFRRKKLSILDDR
jgi:hypothetical protein